MAMASNHDCISDGHNTNGTRYGAAAIRAFAGGRHGSFGAAFLDPVIAESLKTLVSGKRVLDVGCGVGDWCCLAAQYGAKSVDGFDIQPEMLELAKQATSHLDMVHIKVGDAGDMPYDDDSFDVAISLFVTCNLSPEVYAKHFKELQRVLVPGGKAIYLSPSDWCHTELYTRIEADPSTVEDEIAEILETVPRYPTTEQITEAFSHANNILVACFAADQNGKLFRVRSINQLAYSQHIWKKTEVLLYPNFFYSDQSDIENLQSAGFHIDQKENFFTEERRSLFNRKNPNIMLSKKYITNPASWVYYISKPC